MEFVDTHCHPYFDALAGNIEQVIGDAKKAGVTRLISVGTNLDDSAKAIAIAEAYDNVWASVGVHPHEVSEFLADKQAEQRLLELLNKSSTLTPKNKFSGGPVVAVGEIGLDYFKNYSSREDQLAALRRQIEVTLELKLPYIFHVREAWQDFFKVFDSYPNIGGVVHSFSAHQTELEQILSRGLYVGLNGIMTFSSDEQQLAAAKAVPADRLVLETDAPFLAPKPFRGQTCEPKHVVTTAEFLADLRGEGLPELAKFSTKNAIALFGLEAS
ncbi:MAG TPA: TatD family hydrolase [Candidatus Binatia bacterium]|nr:TatD family hydrolase [Candidatus Binatia bacterium]